MQPHVSLRDESCREYNSHVIECVVVITVAKQPHVALRYDSKRTPNIVTCFNVFRNGNDNGRLANACRDTYDSDVGSTLVVMPMCMIDKTITFHNPC